MATNKNKPEPPKKATATANPIPEKEGTVPLSQYDREIQKNNELALELQKATAEKVGVKTELSKWKSRALEAEKKVSDLGNEIGAVETKGFKWALKKVWPLLAFVVVILGVIVWAMAVHISKDTARENKAVQPYKDHVARLQQDSAFLRTGNSYDSLHDVNGKIPAPVDEKKNSSRKMK